MLVLCLTASPALARPAHKQALGEYFGPYLPKKLHDCRACHLPDPPGFKEGDEKPHNAFGLRLVAVKQELKKAGKKTTIAFTGGPLNSVSALPSSVMLTIRASRRMGDSWRSARIMSSASWKPRAARS